MSKGRAIFKDGHEEEILSYSKFGDSITFYTESGKYLYGEYISYSPNGTSYKKSVFYKEEVLIDDNWRTDITYKAIDYIYHIELKEEITDGESGTIFKY